MDDKLILPAWKRLGQRADFPVQVRALDPERPEGQNLFLLVLEETENSRSIGIYGVCARKTIKGGFGRQEGQHYRDIVTRHRLEGKFILGGSSYSFDKRGNVNGRHKFFQKIEGLSKEFGSIFPQIAIDVNDALLNHKKTSDVDVGTKGKLYIHTGWPKFAFAGVGEAWKSLGYYDFPVEGTIQPAIVWANSGERAF